VRRWSMRVQKGEKGPLAKKGPTGAYRRRAKNRKMVSTILPAASDHPTSPDTPCALRAWIRAGLCSPLSLLSLALSSHGPELGNQRAPHSALLRRPAYLRLSSAGAGRPRHSGSEEETAKQGGLRLRLHAASLITTGTGGNVALHRASCGKSVTRSGAVFVLPRRSLRRLAHVHASSSRSPSSALSTGCPLPALHG